MDAHCHSHIVSRCALCAHIQDTLTLAQNTTHYLLLPAAHCVTTAAIGITFRPTERVDAHRIPRFLRHLFGTCSSCVLCDSHETDKTRPGLEFWSATENLTPDGPCGQVSACQHNEQIASAAGAKTFWGAGASPSQTRGCVCKLLNFSRGRRVILSGAVDCTWRRRTFCLEPRVSVYEGLRSII